MRMRAKDVIQQWEPKGANRARVRERAYPVRRLRPSGVRKQRSFVDNLRLV